MLIEKSNQRRQQNQYVFSAYL